MGICTQEHSPYTLGGLPGVQLERARNAPPQPCSEAILSSYGANNGLVVQCVLYVHVMLYKGVEAGKGDGGFGWAGYTC